MKKIILLFAFLLVSVVFIYPQGTDDASQLAYSDGWITGDNGGTGFSTWTLTGGANAGSFIGSSDINTVGKSWGLWAKNSETSSAIRDFSSAMASLDRFTIFMDNGSINSGGTVGFGLQNSSGVNIIEVYFIGGQSEYTVDDNVGIPQSSGFGYTSTGLKIEVELNTPTTYTVKLTPVGGGSTSTVNGTITGTISRLRLFNFNAGDGSSFDAFFNSISHEINVLPVELSSFSANIINKSVNLKWQTATEQNNYGFEIERSQKSVVSSESTTWQSIGFVNGSGNSNSPKEYSYTDNSINNSGNYSYRLKQVDNNGSHEYSSIVEVDYNPVITFDLEQNYPNPFNPVTVINYSLAEPGFVTIKVYNMLGEEVTTLINGQMEAGKHSVEFSTTSGVSSLTSGLYLYKIQAGSFTQVKKMILTK